jgi:N-acetylmuramoyl-L-alanine amidase
MSKAILVIDPGHGGSDPGAVNETLHLNEKDINLRLALFLEEVILGDRLPFSPILTRRADVYLSLASRVQMSNNLKADAFISLHCNAAEDHTARGFEVWTTVGDTPADPLATQLFGALAAAMPGSEGRPDMDDGDPDKETQFYVLRNTYAPAVLVEVEFISNIAAAMFLDDDANLRVIATKLAYAVKDWLGEKP